MQFYFSTKRDIALDTNWEVQYYYDSPPKTPNWIIIPSLLETHAYKSDHADKKYDCDVMFVQR